MNFQRMLINNYHSFQRLSLPIAHQRAPNTSIHFFALNSADNFSCICLNCRKSLNKISILRISWYFSMKMSFCKLPITKYCQILIPSCVLNSAFASPKLGLERRSFLRLGQLPPLDYERNFLFTTQEQKRRIKQQELFPRKQHPEMERTKRY